MAGYAYANPPHACYSLFWQDGDRHTIDTYASTIFISELHALSFGYKTIFLEGLYQSLRMEISNHTDGIDDKAIRGTYALFDVTCTCPFKNRSA